MRFGDLDEAAESQTVDISRRGLYVRMNPPKPIGTRVRFEVKIGSGQALQVEGVVVRVVPDAEDLSPDPQATPGIGVFLTAASESWIRFVDELQCRIRI